MELTKDWGDMVVLASTSQETSSSVLNGLPQVGCGVPVGLNDGSMKPSLAYVAPVLFEPWVNLILFSI